MVLRSGKEGAFCAGADLGELATAYDMLLATPEADRDRVTVEHFSPIGRAFRKLETAGKPLAVALNGLALGGGCELALAAHYRVLTDTEATVIGLPESLVGLLPGGGGTQAAARGSWASRRRPAGPPRRRPPLGRRGARRRGGGRDRRAGAGGSGGRGVDPVRPRPAPALGPAGLARPDTPAEVAQVLDPVRERVLAETGGHYPAPLAILDCLRRGLPVGMDRAVAEEIDVFKGLVQRIEPRNMIGAIFLGRVDLRAQEAQ